MTWSSWTHDIFFFYYLGTKDILVRFKIKVVDSLYPLSCNPLWICYEFRYCWEAPSSRKRNHSISLLTNTFACIKHSLAIEENILVAPFMTKLYGNFWMTNLETISSNYSDRSLRSLEIETCCSHINSSCTLSNVKYILSECRG